MEETRSEIWAGIVILIALVIVVSMVMTVGKYADFYLKPRTSIVVYLNRVHGIKATDPVRCAGMEVGQVTHVGYDVEKEKLKLTLSIFNSILEDKVLREDATASVAVSMMGISTVEISPGTEKPIEAESAAGPIEIQGAETSTLQDITNKAGTLLDNLNQTFGEKQQKQFQEIIQHIRDASVDARKLTAKISASVDENTSGIRAIVDNAKNVTADLAQMTSQNKEHIAQTIQNIKKGSERIDAVFNELDKAIKGINDAVADAKRFVGNVNLVLDENRQTVDDLLRNAKDTTTNIQLMSQDLRRHPWKLLNKPTDREIITGDLAASADQLGVLEKKLDANLERLLKALERNPNDPAVKDMISGLKETIETLRKNQAAMKEQLTNAGGKK